jgi:hypothetical protein
MSSSEIWPLATLAVIEIACKAIDALIAAWSPQNGPTSSLSYAELIFWEMYEKFEVGG